MHRLLHAELLVLRECQRRAQDLQQQMQRVREDVALIYKEMEQRLGLAPGSVERDVLVDLMTGLLEPATRGSAGPELGFVATSRDI